jgi:hypothetical protein
MDPPAQSALSDWLRFAQEHWGTLAVVGLLMVVAFALAQWMLRRRRALPPPPDELALDVSVLPDLPPPLGPPVLEFYHIPVRLAAVVLAPVGRVRELPSREELPEVIDSIVPGLDQIAVAHRPLVRSWPRQLSSRGFASALFQNLRFPADEKDRSVWSAVAGVFRFGDEPIMAGLVLRAETPNRFGNYVMEDEHQWLGILRVRLS